MKHKWLMGTLAAWIIILYLSPLRASESVQVDVKAALSDIALQWKTSRDVPQRDINLREISLAFATLGDLNRAIEITKLMEKSADEQARHSAQLLAIEQNIAAGNFQRALEIMARIRDNDTADQARWLLIKAHIARNDADGLQATQLIDSLKKPDVKASALLMMAALYAKKHENKTALKVLLEASSLAPHNFYFPVHAAPLYAFIGDDATADRYFDKAIKAMLPPMDQLVKDWNKHGDGARPFTELENSIMMSNLQRQMLQHGLFQAGFVEKWWQLYKNDPNAPAIFQLNLLTLLQYDHVDAAIKEIETLPFKNSINHAMTLISIAQHISSTQPNKALAQLYKASEILVNTSKQNLSIEAKELLSSFYISLSSLYRAMGKKREAQKSVHKGMQGLSAAQIARWKLIYSLSQSPSLLIAGEIGDLKLTSQQITQFNRDIRRYLELEKNNINGLHNWGAMFINYQIKLGQIDEAKSNAALLDTILRKQFTGGGYQKQEMDLAVEAVNIASIWKRLDDKKRSSAIIRYTLDLSEKEWPLPRKERLNMLLQLMPPKDGIRLWNSLPPQQRENVRPDWQRWGHAFGAEYPDQFPQEMLEKIPLVAKTNFLSSYVNGLTKSTFTGNEMQIKGPHYYFYEDVLGMVHALP